MRNILPWRANFAVGHEQLDKEHRRLVALINQLGTIIRGKPDTKQSVDTLKELRRSAVDHLRHENEVLHQIQTGLYKLRSGLAEAELLSSTAIADACEDHIREHDALFTRFDEIVHGPVSNLCEGLKAWFVDHAKGHDLELKMLLRTLMPP